MEKGKDVKSALKKMQARVEFSRNC